MKILIVAATGAEIAPLLEFLGQNRKAEADNQFTVDGHTISVCISGVGMMPSAYHITKAIADFQPELALQAGIAGAFDTHIALGQVVAVAAEYPGDLGAEDHEQYIDIFSLGFLEPDTFPFAGGFLPATKSILPAGLPQVRSLSVNTVSGHPATIARRAGFGCDIETMEGAAFHYVCLQEQIPFVQVRSISNYVEPRDRSKWQIGLAVRHLNEWLVAYINSI